MPVRRRRSPSFQTSQSTESSSPLANDVNDQEVVTNMHEGTRVEVAPPSETLHASGLSSTSSETATTRTLATSAVASTMPPRASRLQVRDNVRAMSNVNGGSLGSPAAPEPSAADWIQVSSPPPPGSSRVQQSGGINTTPTVGNGTSGTNAAEVASRRPDSLPPPPPLPRTALVPPPAPLLRPRPSVLSSPRGAAANARGPTSERRGQYNASSEQQQAAISSMINLEPPDGSTSESTARRRVPQHQLQPESGHAGVTAVPDMRRVVAYQLQQRQAPAAARAGGAARLTSPAAGLGTGAGRPTNPATAAVPSNAAPRAGGSVFRVRLPGSSAVSGAAVGDRQGDHTNPGGGTAGGGPNGNGVDGERDSGGGVGGSDGAGVTNGEGSSGPGGGGGGAAASPGGAVSGRPAASPSINQLHKASVVGDLTSISRFINDGGNLEAQSFCG